MTEIPPGVPTVEWCLGVLGLASGASAEEIRVAYRDLVKVWHPDRFDGDSRVQKKAEEALKAINLAYEVLQRGGEEPGEVRDASSDEASGRGTSSAQGRRQERAEPAGQPPPAAPPINPTEPQADSSSPRPTPQSKSIWTQALSWVWVLLGLVLLRAGYVSVRSVVAHMWRGGGPGPTATRLLDDRLGSSSVREGSSFTMLADTALVDSSRVVSSPSADLGPDSASRFAVLLDRPVRVTAFTKGPEADFNGHWSVQLRVGSNDDWFEGYTGFPGLCAPTWDAVVGLLRRTVGWRDRYLFVRQQSGGNHWKSEVEAVFELQGERLVHLGTLAAWGDSAIGTCFRSGRFLDYETDFEVNDLTCHAGAPGFTLVLEEHGGRLVAVLDSTWQANAVLYERNVAEAARQREQLRDTASLGDWELVLDPLLENAVIAKYCNRNEELQDALKRVREAVPATLVPGVLRMVEGVAPGRLPASTVDPDYSFARIGHP